MSQDFGPTRQSTRDHICPACQEPILPDDKVIRARKDTVHRACVSDRGGGVGFALSGAERRVLSLLCSHHPVGRCHACQRSFKFDEFGEDLTGHGDFCPVCRGDVADSVRLHILCCPEIAAALQEEVDRSKMNIKQSEQMKTESTMLCLESHARIAAVLRKVGGPRSV